MPLTREITKGKTSLDAYPILLMGPPGVGKSTFVASMYPAEAAFFVDSDITESLVQFDLPKARVTSWGEFGNIVTEYLKDDYYRYLVIDTLNGVYDLCMRQVCQEKGISNPGEVNDYGATWAMLADRFMRPLIAIAKAGKGLICTSHATITEVTIGIRRYNRWIPSFTGSSIQSAYARVESFFPIIGFMTRESCEAPPSKVITRKSKGGGKEHVEVVDVKRDLGDLASTNRRIYFQPGENWIAKDRSGKLPAFIDLPDDWREDWPTLKNNFTGENKNGN